MTSLDAAGPAVGPAGGPATRPAPVAGEPPVVLAGLLADLIPEGRPVPREEAVTLLRRHLGRIQNRVQQAFEAHDLSGLAAARWLASLTDTVMVGIRAYTDAMLPPGATDKPWALVATGGYGRGVRQRHLPQCTAHSAAGGTGPGGGENAPDYRGDAPSGGAGGGQLVGAVGDSAGAPGAGKLAQRGAFPPEYAPYGYGSNHLCTGNLGKFQRNFKKTVYKCKNI